MKSIKGLMVLLLCISLVGCSNDNRSSIDEKIANKLDADYLVQDFYLDDIYYELPAPLSQFVDNGWKVLFDKSEVELNRDTILNPYVYVELQLKKQDMLLTLVVMNDSNEPSNFMSENVKAHSVNINFTESEEKISVIVKGGITENLSESNVNKILKEINIKLKEEDNDFIDDDKIEDEDGNDCLRINFYKDEITEIIIGNERAYINYLPYEDEMMKTTNISNQKKKVDKRFDMNVSGDFEKLVAMYDNKEMGSSLIVVNFTGNVIQMVELSTTFYYGSNDATTDLPSGVGYLIQDNNGNLYCIQQTETKGYDYVEWNADAFDAQIELWGNMNELIEMTDDNNRKIPLIQPLLIEKNGEIIYRKKVSVE